MDRSKAGTSCSHARSVRAQASSASGGGPSNVAATVVAQVNLTVQGQTADAFLNVAFITGPSIEAEVDFQNVGAPIPADLRIPVVANVAARAAQG